MVNSPLDTTAALLVDSAFLSDFLRNLQVNTLTLILLNLRQGISHSALPDFPVLPHTSNKSRCGFRMQFLNLSHRSVNRLQLSTHIQTA